MFLDLISLEELHKHWRWFTETKDSEWFREATMNEITAGDVKWAGPVINFWAGDWSDYQWDWRIPLTDIKPPIGLPRKP